MNVHKQQHSVPITDIIDRWRSTALNDVVASPHMPLTSTPSQRHLAWHFLKTHGIAAAE